MPKQLIKKIFFPMLALALLAGCGEKAQSAKPAPSRPQVESEELQFAAPEPGDPIAIFDTTAGELRAVLYPEESPLAVENFTTLAQQGYYDGTLLFRSVYGFAVQGGDGTAGDGSSSDTAWDGDGFDIEYSQQLYHYAGALCVAFAPDDAQSGASQFYFVTALPGKVENSLLDQLREAGYRDEVLNAYQAAGGLPYLDNTDTVFGQLYSGWEALDAIACADTDGNDRPLEDVVVNSVRIAEYEGA